MTDRCTKCGEHACEREDLLLDAVDYLRRAEVYSRILVEAPL